METYRLGYFKVLKTKIFNAIIDTNILLLSIRYGTDIIEAIEDALLAKCEVHVPEIVIKELQRKMNEGGFKERKEAKRALEIVKNKLHVLKHDEITYSKADDIVLTLAMQQKAILISNDKELRRRAKRLSIPTGRLDIKSKRIIIEGVFE